MFSYYAISFLLCHDKIFLFFFFLLQKFVSIRNNLSSSYETKISELLSIWKGCVVVLNEHTCSGSHVFMHFAAR